MGEVFCWFIFIPRVPHLRPRPYASLRPRPWVFLSLIPPSFYHSSGAQSALFLHLGGGPGSVPKPLRSVPRCHLLHPCGWKTAGCTCVCSVLGLVLILPLSGSVILNVASTDLRLSSRPLSHLLDMGPGLARTLLHCGRSCDFPSVWAPGLCTRPCLIGMLALPTFCLLLAARPSFLTSDTTFSRKSSLVAPVRIIPQHPVCAYLCPGATHFVFESASLIRL